MCYEVLIGTALAAAGTGVSMAGAAQSRKAMNQQVVAGLKRQEQYQKEATPIFNQSLEDSSREKFDAARRAGEAQAQAGYEEQGALPGDKNPLPTDASRAKLQTKQSRATAAAGEGYREGFANQGTKNMEANRRLGVISGLAGGSAQTTGILTTLASQKGADMAGIGSLLSTAGSLAAMYGAVNSAKAPPPTAGGMNLGATTRDWNKVA